MDNIFQLTVYKLIHKPRVSTTADAALEFGEKITFCASFEEKHRLIQFRERSV